jgi:hypothetical protein
MKVDDFTPITGIIKRAKTPGIPTNNAARLKLRLQVSRQSGL